MTWFILALICTLGWGCADLFYKIGSDEDDSNSHLKISVWVGLVMGVAAFCLIPFSESGANVVNIAKNALRYSPASISYIVSMVIGYAGLRYLELSIVSPVQNASGAFSAICMFVYFAVKGNASSITEEYSALDLAGTAVIVVGVIALAVVEQHLSDKEKKLDEAQRKYKYGALSLLFPIFYCIFDTIGTAADGIILSEESGYNIGEIDVLALYGLTFFVAGIVSWIVIFIKEKKPYNPFTKKEILSKGIAALCEEFGQVFYVFAMAAKPVLAAPMIASYCIVSVVLSRIFIKEKMKASQYACVALVLCGILCLGISEGISDLSDEQYVVTAVSADEVREVLELHHYATEDLTSDTNEEWNTDKIQSVVATEQDAVIFDFYTLYYKDDAAKMYTRYVELLNQEGGSGVERTKGNITMYENVYDGKTTYLIKCEKTFLYCSVSDWYLDSMKSVLKEINYYI